MELGQAVLTVQTLQMLLAQQSASLLEAQQAGLRTALKELEDRQEVKMDRLDAKLDEASERTTNLETQLEAAVDRIHVLEERGHQQGGAPGGDHRKHSLVFSGWCDNTRRNAILHQLDESLKHLGLLPTLILLLSRLARGEQSPCATSHSGAVSSSLT